MRLFREYVNPHLGELLEKIKLDKEYIKGEGCYLYDREGSRYLDCIANYGAVPFGHNHREIWQCIEEFSRSQEPSLVKPSALRAAGELARRLSELTPEELRYVTFTNSGTEAVEAAIKLSRAATGRKGILSTENSFHGKTMGALSATGNPKYQDIFGAPISGFDYVKYGDTASLEAEFKSKPEYYAAFIVEPIQGEGGIVLPPAGYLKEARELCRQYEVLFILDEIQTGLGRTGSLFAFEEEGVAPDILLLAKALGGGIIPIGACISTAEVYTEDFGNKHSSTFAGNSLACRIGLKVLELLTRNDQELIREVKSKGEIFKEKLQSLAGEYPRILGPVRGRGLMLGLEFKVDRSSFPGSLLGIMAEQELLTPIISSYLLNKEGLMVAPTLNGNHVIRLEPSLTISDEELMTALRGIENMLSVLDRGNTAQFISYLIDAEYPEYRPCLNVEFDQDGQSGGRDVGLVEAEAGAEDASDSVSTREGRFAFLIHPLDLKNYCEYDESLYTFTQKELAELTGRWNDMVDPFVTAETTIHSQSGAVASGDFIAIPRTTEELLEMPNREALELVKEAIELARKRGAKIVGLGAYTSVVSRGGLYVKDEGIPVTTGNSYTVVAAVDAVIEALKRLDMSPAYTTAAVVGATGSIGKGTATLLAESVSRLILIGNPEHKKSSLKRLYQVAADIYRHIAVQLAQNRVFTPNTLGYRLKNSNLPAGDARESDFIRFAKENREGPIIISTAIEQMLPRAEVIVSATSTIKTLIRPENLKRGAVVCDISRPANVSMEIDRERPDVLVIDGGVMEVPGRPSLGWNFGFERGLAYACMAETMMLALEQYPENMSIGSSGVNLESILFTRELAAKHGFKLASLRSFDRPLSEKKWNSIIEAREDEERSEESV